MTFVYGATLGGTQDFIREYMEYEANSPAPAEDAQKYYTYCAKKLFQGIAATVPAAEDAMRWLRSVAKCMPIGRRMEWATPTGFLVQHDYIGFDMKRVEFRSSSVLSKLLVGEPNDDTRPVQMQNGIAPNFVHAMDASHLMLTACAMKQHRHALVTIHDSFGTHPSSVDSMHRLIREAFVELYQNTQYMQDFLWDVGGYGEPPRLGKLDLNQVLKSEFFFS